MPIREPRKMVIYIDDEVHHFRSVRSGIMFFAEHMGISFAGAKWRINKVCRENDGNFRNFRFVKDPSYVTSRPVVATNLITGDYIIFPSVNKTAEYIFGKHEISGSSRIAELCRSERIHHATGLTFKYIENGYVFSPNMHRTDFKRPILQLIRDTDAFMNYFHSVTDASEYIFDMGISSTSKQNIKNQISSAANGKSPDCKAPYGFKWRYVRHDEPPENVALPEPNYEGL